MSSESVLHSLAISQVMVNYAAAHGVDIETCLQGTQVAPEQFQDAEALIRPEQEMRLIENLMLALPDIPALGFELGKLYNVSTFGAWGFALRTSRNIREAIERAVRYIPLSTAYCIFDTCIDDGEYILTADPKDIPLQIRQFLLERDLGTAITLIRELNLTGHSIRELQFAEPAPAYAERIRELSDIPVSFGAGRNAIVMDLQTIDTPLPTYDEHLMRLLEDQCKQLMETRQIEGITGQVRQRLLGKLGLVASLEEIAKDLNMSARSLSRKLDAENQSFRHIVEETRRQLAGQLLETTEMKLDEMALQLGYTDTASFTRAFRRWHGKSPGQYRAGLKQ